MRYSSPVTPTCMFSSPIIWTFSGLVLSLVVGFFSGSPTWTRIYFTFNKCFFKHHVNTSSLMCGSRGKWLIINLSYHICISFIFSPFPCNITYMFWLATSYSCPSFTVLVWSHHWWSRYLFALMPLWERTYNNPRYPSGYYRNYYFVEWSTCLEGGVPPFPLPQSMMSGYPYH
jgi:hypothetical protein